MIDRLIDNFATTPKRSTLSIKVVDLSADTTTADGAAVSFEQNLQQLDLSTKKRAGQATKVLDDMMAQVSSAKQQLDAAADQLQDVFSGGSESEAPSGKTEASAARIEATSIEFTKRQIANRGESAVKVQTAKLSMTSVNALYTGS